MADEGVLLSPNDAYYQTSKLVFFNAAPNFEKLKSSRGIANTTIGICYYLKNNPSDNSMTERLRNLTNVLIKQYMENLTNDWKWSESLLAYLISHLTVLHAYEEYHESDLKIV